MSILVCSNGVGANLQDKGRFGFQHLGIPPSGPMDLHAFEKGQALLCHHPQTAAIESCFPAPQFLFEQACFMVLTGADFGAVLEWENDKGPQSLPLSLDRPTYVSAGCRLRFTQKKSGQYVYLAVQGGFDLDEWLNSCSTNLMAGAGGHAGRCLQNGDRLFFTAKKGWEKEKKGPDQPAPMSWWAKDWRSLPEKNLSFVPGPDAHRLSSPAWEVFCQQDYCCTAASNRMGFRLQAKPLDLLPAHTRWSALVVRGSIQCLPNGQLIVLMADHQSTGGYPVLGVLTPTAVDALAQWPKEKVFCFSPIDVDQAQKEQVADAQKLRQLEIACTFPLYAHH